jgi:hypothetical protein
MVLMGSSNMEEIKKPHETFPGLEQFLYVDTDGNVRDSNIEHMFEDCFYGKELDDTFRTNFRQYLRVFTDADETLPADETFANVSKLLRWSKPIFGGLTIYKADPTVIAVSPALREAGATHAAVFNDTRRWKLLPCYAPSELHAAFCALVSAFRVTALLHTQNMFKDLPKH